MAKNTLDSCKMYPSVVYHDKKGHVHREISDTYRELSKLCANRPLTNLIYASYLQDGVADAMTNAGYKPNKQGQHKASDVYRFFNVNEMKKGGTFASLQELGMTQGVLDRYGNPIEFTSAEDAINRALVINDMQGASAYVQQVGDNFQVMLRPKDSISLLYKDNLQKTLEIWDRITHAFNTISVDLNSLEFSRGRVNALIGKSFIQGLRSLVLTENRYLSKDDIKTLLLMDKNSTGVTRLMSRYGTLDGAVDAIYTGYRSSLGTPGAFTAAEAALVENTLRVCKNLQGLDINGLYNDISRIEQNYQNTDSYKINRTLNDLVHSGVENLLDTEINQTSREINTLQQAAAEAAVILQRQLRILKEQQGLTPEVAALEQSIKLLSANITSNNYTIGVLQFLTETSNQFRRIKDLLETPLPTGSTLEKSAAASAILLEISQIQASYMRVLRALQNIDSLLAGEFITEENKATIKEKATELFRYFDSYEKIISGLRESTMIDITTELLGDQLSNGTSIVDLVQMAEADCSIYDYLYAMSRCSNPLVAAMGTIIRDKQLERDQALTKIAVRIRRANNRLRKAGYDSRFMYEVNAFTGEPTGYIISSSDYNAYNTAYREYKMYLKSTGLDGVALEEALESWVESNTEEVVVDNNNGRTERVPRRDLYRKDMPPMTSEQREYYDTMMQIKGELGSLLPEYAQKQFLAPQIRRSFLDAVRDSFRGGVHVKDLVKALLRKFKDLYTIREDDTRFAENGLVEGEEVIYGEGNLDDTPVKKIPIFYLNPLKESGELLMDFSGALQSFAATAINYAAMNEIKDTIEFMADYVKGMPVKSTKEGMTVKEKLEYQALHIFKNLRGLADNSNTVNIVNSFLDMHMYGKSLKGSSKWRKLWLNILSYNSMRSLSVNLKGAINNIIVGEIQTLIEAGSNEFYGIRDWMWAQTMVLGDNTLKAPGRVMDFFTGQENSKTVLLERMFDPMDENYSDLAHKRYYKGPLRYLLGKDFTFIGYGAGEHILHFINMYAVLKATKIKINGKRTSLYNALKKVKSPDGVAELEIDPDATYEDEYGNWVPIDNAYIKKIKDRIRYCNQTTHGSMSEEDKGLIHQWILGRFVMNLRQWTVEHYSRRFRKMHYDGSLREEREGYYRTVGRLFGAWASDLLHFEYEAALHWNEMSIGQKKNVRRALSEQLIIALLYGLSFALGEPEDHKKEFWYRMWIYQTRRALMESRGSSWGIPAEADKMINSPIAATNTINALLYPVVGIGDVTKVVESGDYKGWNLYGKNLYKYWLPFVKHIKELESFSEDDKIFNYMEKSSLQ